MVYRRGIEAYEEFLTQSLNIVERIGGVFTGLDERLDYLNRTMIRIEELLKQLTGVPVLAPPPRVPALPGVLVPAALPEITLDGRLDTLLLFAASIMDWGKVSGGTKSKLIVTGKMWEDNIWRGAECVILWGMGVGQLRTITGNEAEKLAIRPDWDISPDGTSVYAIRTQTRFLGDPIARAGRYSGASTDFQDLVAWTVSSDKIGDLHEISWISDNDEKTRFQLTIAGVDQEIPDEQIDSPLTLPFRMNSLAPSSAVTLKVKSSDGTTINVSGSITGTER